jgi:hypothetical protein
MVSAMVWRVRSLIGVECAGIIDDGERFIDMLQTNSSVDNCKCDSKARS